MEKAILFVLIFLLGYSGIFEKITKKFFDKK